MFIGTNYKSYAQEKGGKVIILLFLFLLSLYEFYSIGFSAFALICILPLFVLGGYFIFNYQMHFFWILFIINYTIMGISRYYDFPIPITAITIMPQVLLLMVLILDISKNHNGKYGNLMLLSLVIWAVFMLLQLGNRTCDLPISFSSWFQNFLFYSLAFFITYFIISTIINTPEKIMKFLRWWAYFAIAAVLWAWRQKTFGWDNAENIWLITGGATTHIIGGSIRYFSFFSDAANYGCHIAAAAVAFYIVAITTKTKKDKILFLTAAILCTYGFFLSGTRTGLLCFLVGVAFYVVLSKSFKIAIPVAILGGSFFFILAFTQIGQGNMQIRRMRTAFNKDDASANVRDINKQALKKYLRDAPFGLGMNIDINNIPANHKYKIVTQTASDSTYVYLWEYTGIIGTCFFAFINILILLGGCYITLFRLHRASVQGIGGAFCCAFISIQTGGYANNILLQYPNILIFYGGMTIVYILPHIEISWIEYENKRTALQEEKKRLRIEKKLASRV